MFTCTTARLSSIWVRAVGVAVTNRKLNDVIWWAGGPRIMYYKIFQKKARTRPCSSTWTQRGSEKWSKMCNLNSISAQAPFAQLFVMEWPYHLKRGASLPLVFLFSRDVPPYLEVRYMEPELSLEHSTRPGVRHNVSTSSRERIEIARQTYDHAV